MTITDAREKAVHDLAAVLTAFASGTHEESGKRFALAVLQPAEPDPALVGAVRATLRQLHLVVAEPELMDRVNATVEDHEAHRQAKLDLAQSVARQVWGWR